MDEAQKLNLLMENMNSIENMPAETNLLMKKMLNKGHNNLRKEEIDTRPTNMKEVYSYFRESFRFDLAKHGLYEVVGWTILAEIVMSRTSPKVFIFIF